MNSEYSKSLNFTQKHFFFECRDNKKSNVALNTQRKPNLDKLIS